jgi:acetyltransferase
MGGDGIAEGEAILDGSQIPTYRYPDAAASLFNLMWKYRYNLRGLYETPVLPVSESDPARERVSEILDPPGRPARELLTEVESNSLLGAYGFPVVPTGSARDEEGAVSLANSIGYPVAVKLLSATTVHKSAVGGVILNVNDPEGVRGAYRSIFGRSDAADFLGVTVQPMISRLGGHELFLGSSLDVRFGPVIVFGAGGKPVEILGDRSVALPPLNTTLARRLMEGTRIYRALSPGVVEILAGLLTRFSRLVVEQPRVRAIAIDPLHADSKGVTVLSASIVLHPRDTAPERLSHPAIRPYPGRYVGDWTTPKGLNVTIRPIRAEDEPLVRQFHGELSERTLYFRYFHVVDLNRQTAYDRLTRVCFIDYDRVMTLLVEARDRDTRAARLLGLGRLTKLHGRNEAEFDLLVSDALQGHGLGTELLRRLVSIARDEGLDRIRGDILPENRAMRRVAEKVGFSLRRERDLVEAEYTL